MDKKKYVYAKFGEEDSKEVTLRLYGGIGDFSEDIDGNLFASHMMELHDAGYKIQIDINSEGGDVIRGYSILDAVIKTGATTRIVGIAASMAGVIYLFGKNRIMNDFSSIMVHAPSGGEEDLRNIVRAQLKTLLSNRSKFTEEQIEDIFNSGKNYWYALQGVPDDRNAQKYGLVDTILPTGKKAPANILEKEGNKTNLVGIYAKLISNNTSTHNKNNMEQVKAHLLLDNSANEAATIKAIDAKVEDAVKIAVEAGQKEVETLKNKIESLETEKIDGLVCQAKEGKYPEEGLESLKTVAKADFEVAKNVLKAFLGASKVGVKTPVVSMVPVGGAGAEVKNYAFYQKPENEAAWCALSEEEKIEITNKL